MILGLTRTWRIKLLPLLITVLVNSTFNYGDAFGSVKKELPRIVVSSVFTSTTNSASPEGNAITFIQTMKVGPIERSSVMFGNTVATRLEYQLTNEVYEIQGMGGKGRDAYNFSAGFEDSMRRLQFGVSSEHKGAFRRDPANPFGTLEELTDTRSFWIRQALPRSTLLTAQTSLSSSNIGFSEEFAGYYSLESRQPGVYFFVDRRFEERKNFSASTGTARDITKLVWKLDRDTPLGKLSTDYEFNETVSSTRASEPDIGKEEDLRFKLDKQVGPVRLVGSLLKKQKSPSRTLSTEEEKQTVQLTYDLPLTKAKKGTLSFEGTSNQNVGGGKDIGVNKTTYSLNLKPTEELTLDISVKDEETTNLNLNLGEKSESSTSARINFKPNQVFSLDLKADQKGINELTTDRRQSWNTYTLVAGIKPNRAVSLRLLLANSFQELGLTQETTTASAGITMNPSAQFSIGADFSTLSINTGPLDRRIEETLGLTLGYSISENISWQFTLRGEANKDRNRPYLNRETNTVTSTLVIRF